MLENVEVSLPPNPITGSSQGELIITSLMKTSPSSLHCKAQQTHVNIIRAYTRNAPKLGKKKDKQRRSRCSWDSIGPLHEQDISTWIDPPTPQSVFSWHATAKSKKFNKRPPCDMARGPNYFYPRRSGRTGPQLQGMPNWSTISIKVPKHRIWTNKSLIP